MGIRSLDSVVIVFKVHGRTMHCGVFGEGWTTSSLYLNVKIRLIMFWGVLPLLVACTCEELRRDLLFDAALIPEF